MYTESFVLDGIDQANCGLDDDAWRGDCCRPCPTPTDMAATLTECVDCTAVGNDTDLYGDPVGDHGVMTPRVLVGFSQSATGKNRSNPPAPRSCTLGQCLGDAWTAGEVCVDAAPCKAAVVELNLFRCPFQTDPKAGVLGSCLGQVRVGENGTHDSMSSNGTAMNSSNLSNDTAMWHWGTEMCYAGYAGSLCGACKDGYTMTKDGCVACDPAGTSDLIVIAIGGLLAVVATVFAARRLQQYLQGHSQQGAAAAEEAKEEAARKKKEEEAAEAATQAKVDGVDKQPKAAKAMWKRARLVKHVAGFQLSSGN